MSNGQTSNLFLLHLTVDGVPIPDPWDKKTGGEVTPQETKWRPGGRPDQVSLGGPRDVGNVTISRLFVRERDHALAKSLMAKSGKSTCVLTQQPLDSDYQPWGDPVVYTGRLGKVSYPEADSNSQGASMFELEISSQGLPA